MLINIFEQPYKTWKYKVLLYILTYELILIFNLCVCQLLSRVQLFVGPCSPPGSSVHGILQARKLEWVAMPFSRGSSGPRDLTQVSHIAGRFFMPQLLVYLIQIGYIHICIYICMYVCIFLLLFSFLFQFSFSTLNLPVLYSFLSLNN